MHGNLKNYQIVKWYLLRWGPQYGALTDISIYTYYWCAFSEIMRICMHLIKYACSSKLDAILCGPCSCFCPKWPHKQPQSIYRLLWSAMLIHAYMHLSHPCNPPSKNPGYGPANYEEF